MNRSTFFLVGTLVVALVATAFVMPSQTAALPSSPAEDEFSFAEIIPNDVFLYVSSKKNPERAFLDQYWGEVFEALRESGIGEDVISLFSSLVGIGNEEVAAEVGRLRERALRLVDGVDWEMLAGKETVFAERFVLPDELFSGRPPVMTPQMVWLFRGSAEGAARNFAGLTAILDALAEEVNRAVGKDVLAVKKTSRKGITVASIDLTASAPGVPSMPLSLAVRDDVVIIGMREHLFDEVLDLMRGVGGKTALADDPRFQAAFAQLPPAEDVMSFFDMQAIVKTLRGIGDTLISAMTAPKDIKRNAGASAEANEIHNAARSAYGSGDFDTAVALVEKAHAAAPGSSLILYNVACFNALAGNGDEALGWLRKAVEGGFYAPRKIGSDPDLKSLHGTTAFGETVARAAELARLARAKDTVVNSSTDKEVLRLRMQIRQVYEEKDYNRGLELAEQAAAIAPSCSQVLYIQGCFHTLLGHEEKGFDFLEKAVEGGFYCPRHIRKDPDWKNLSEHERFKGALHRAAELAGKEELNRTGEWVSTVNRLVDRLMSSMGVLDYSAGIETTDGYTTSSETIGVLVSDAPERPIYALFGKRQSLTGFERFLPEETDSFSIAGGFDIGAFYRFLEESVRLIGPRGEEVLARWEEIQKEIGFDIRRDFFDWFDGDSISVTLAEGGTVSLIKVTDEKTAREKVTAAIEFTTTALGQIMAKNPALAGLAMVRMRTSPLEHEKLEGFQKLRFAMSPEPVVWGVADGHLIFGTSADAVALCLATAKGEHPNIRNSSRAMKEALIPPGPFVTMSYSNLRSQGEEIETGLGIASMVMGMMGAFIPEPKVRPVITGISGILGKLGPVVRKIDFYKSKAAYTTFDGRMWHSYGVTHYFAPEERPQRDE
jgi:hypothetical protein